MCFCRWWEGTTVYSFKSRDTDHNLDLYYFSSTLFQRAEVRSDSWEEETPQFWLSTATCLTSLKKENYRQQMSLLEGASDRTHPTGFSRCYKFNYFFGSLMTAFARNTCSYLLELTFHIQSPLMPNFCLLAHSPTTSRHPQVACMLGNKKALLLKG